MKINERKYLIFVFCFFFIWHKFREITAFLWNFSKNDNGNWNGNFATRDWWLSCK